MTVTRTLALAALVLVGAGCRDESIAVGPDLASPIYFCPTAPPADRSYACEPTAIPYCAFPTEQVTCYCVADASGNYALDCAVDAGATTD